MRVLASVLPGTGHLLPLVPTLHALRDAGHTVVVASAEPLRAEVEAAELDFAPVGPPWHESDADALLPGFQAAGSAGQLRMFVELAPTVLPDLLTLTGNVRPDLLVREPYEFAAWLAAERCQLPMVVHAIGVVSGSPLLFAALAGEPLAAARAAAGLPADPELWARCSAPPSTCCAPWWRGVAALDVEVLVTTGPAVDPAVLGRQPDHVHAARFVPQQQVLDAAAAVVCHAGVGTVYGALSVGVPLVVVPLAADQPVCAMGCVLAGTAVSRRRRTSWPS